MRTLARGILRLLGWRLVYTPPPGRSYVLVGAPHTSNWDFPLALLALWALGIRGRWLGKRELFRSPLMGALMRALGGIPVDRGQRNNLVAQVARLLREKAIAVLITPEGTRGQAPYWRTGFYYMALEAGVPIALGFLDASRRELGIGGYLWPTGDLEADFERLRAFYQGKKGLKPHKQGPIRPKPREEAGEKA